MNAIRGAGAALLLAALAGCVGTQPDNPALVEARQTYTRVSADPVAVRNAPLEVRRAEEALRRAEAAQAQRVNTNEVSHLSYLATRQAQIAQEVGALKEARDAIAAAGLRRGPAGWR